MSMASQSGWVEFSDLTAVELDYRDAFVKAQSRLNSILARQPRLAVHIEGKSIQGVLINASSEKIDGPQGILGSAGPTHIRTGNNLPVMGIMKFDSSDLARLKEKGELEDVILHEMFHVLGAGTLWQHRKLLINSETDNPQYIGKSALDEYHLLKGHENEKSIPVANRGGPGTKNGHWRETTFGAELNTGFISGDHRPLSRMSIAALADIGYEQLAIEEADPYQLPETSGLLSIRSSMMCCSTIIRPEFHIVGSSGEAP
ncbi:MAG: hypothetical protein ACRBBN_02235 [Methyloligellaceae bacterium]